MPSFFGGMGDVLLGLPVYAHPPQPPQPKPQNIGPRFWGGALGGQAPMHQVPRKALAPHAKSYVMKEQPNANWFVNEFGDKIYFSDKSVPTKPVQGWTWAQEMGAEKAAKEQSQQPGTNSSQPPAQPPIQINRPQDFAAVFLQDVGLPVTAQNIGDIVSQIAGEGGWTGNNVGEWFNPLNTQRQGYGAYYPVAGSPQPGYPNWNQGVAATAAALTNGLYGGIIETLAKGNAPFSEFTKAVEGSPWATGKYTGGIAWNPNYDPGLQGPQATNRNYYPQTPAGQQAANTNTAKEIDYAQSQLGVPYQWGGESPNTAWDCSGLVQYSLQQAGIQGVPRTSQEQYQWLKGMGATFSDPNQAQPGDLVFFAEGDPEAPGHVGIYLGNGYMINAPHTGANVEIVPVGSPSSFGRPPGEQGQVPAYTGGTQQPVSMSSGAGGGGGGTTGGAGGISSGGTAVSPATSDMMGLMMASQMMMPFQAALSPAIASNVTAPLSDFSQGAFTNYGNMPGIDYTGDYSDSSNQ